VNPLATPFMAVGALGGIVVQESPALRYDEMYIAPDGPYIVVGERAHFEYRLAQIQANQECREQAAGRLRHAAWRILGEEVR